MAIYYYSGSISGSQWLALLFLVIQTGLSSFASRLSENVLILYAYTTINGSFLYFTLVVLLETDGLFDAGVR